MPLLPAPAAPPNVFTVFTTTTHSILRRGSERLRGGDSPLFDLKSVNTVTKMGKRYHCDYCDKTFPDSANNRKKHLQGAFHTRMKRIHYDAFRDAEAIFKIESVKKPCRRFQQTGECDYGTTCKFSHLSPGELTELAARADAEKRAAKQCASVPLPKSVTVTEWANRHFKTQEKLPEPFAYKDMIATQLSFFNNNLSISMRAPTLDDLLSCRPNHWG